MRWQTFSLCRGLHGTAQFLRADRDERQESVVVTDTAECAALGACELVQLTDLLTVPLS